MFHKSTVLKNQQGSMLVIALFVMIVLAFLAYAMIAITDNSHKSNVYEVYGGRALNAANSGVERALNDILGPDGTDDCSDVSNYSLPNIVPFSGCSLELQCNQFDVTSTKFTHFSITSTASCSAGNFDTQRSVIVEARIPTL